MKIGVAMTTRDANGRVDSRFGRAPHFALVDSEAGNVSWMPNPGTAMLGGAGVGTAQALASAGVEAVAAGNFGPNASAVLQAAGIKLFSCAGLTLDAAVAAVCSGDAQELHSPTVASHWQPPADQSQDPSPQSGTTAGTGLRGAGRGRRGGGMGGGAGGGPGGDPGRSQGDGSGRRPGGGRGRGGQSGCSSGGGRA